MGDTTVSAACYTVRTEAMEYAMSIAAKLVTERPATDAPRCLCGADVKIEMEFDTHTVRRCAPCFAYYMAGFMGKKVTVYV